MDKYEQMASAFGAQLSTCHYSPLHVYIEPTNKCNLSCSHCPNKDEGREHGFMNGALYASLICQLKEMEVEWVYLFHGGEPMLHFQIEAMIAYARDRDIKVRMHTNGTHDLSHLAYRIDRLCLSVNHTLFSDVYKTIEGLLDVVSPAKTIMELCDQPELFEFYDYRDNMHNWRGEVEGNILLFDRPRCSQPYKTFVVLWDGRVALCCADDGEKIIGDANQENLIDIWNSEPMQKQRLNPTEFCRECTMKDSVKVERVSVNV